MIRMENEEQKAYENGIDTCFHNMGGPRSRTRIESVRSLFLDKDDDGSTQMCYNVKIHQNVNEVEKWLLGKGCIKDWKEILHLVNLPKSKHMVISIDDKEISSHKTILKMLEAAIILSKCNKYMYLPDSPMIFTRARLDRNIKLMKINIEKYYEMD